MKLGIKGGIDVSEMSFSGDLFKKSNRMGYFIGPTLKFPLLGLGFDISALYSKRNGELRGVYLEQDTSLAGFENNPRTMFIGADMPFYAFNSYHGAGIQLVNDQIGLFTHQQINVQYSLKMKLFGGQLGVGFQFGILNESFSSSELDLEEPTDPAFSTSDVNGNHVDMAAGLYYSHKNWYVGASVLHAMSPLIHLGELNEIQVDRTYYLTAGYNIKLS